MKTILAPSPETFDPISYIRDVRAKPETYVKVTDVIAAVNDLQRIRKASPMAELRRVFLQLSRDYKEDPAMLLMLTEAKDKRKAELEKQA